MTLKECYEALELHEGADLADIKRAYRRRAFALHPDLNPDVFDGTRRFQRINEAYVLLCQAVESGAPRPGGKFSEEATARAREEAHKAYRARQEGQGSPGSGNDDGSGREHVLRDILNDPFARRVFEDIYSHIQEKGRKSAAREQTQGARGKNKGGCVKNEGPAAKKNGDLPGNAAAKEGSPYPGVVGRLKGWLRRQIDDEQVLRLPGASLVPGARVRLEIQHGFSGEPQIVELTLPPEFQPGKSMRLKGMGKRLGNWKGDLYVRIEPV